MYLAQVTFGTIAGNAANRDALSDLADKYLGRLCRDGQICGSFYFAWCNGQLVAYTHVARPDSFVKRYHSQWGTAELRGIIEAFGQGPRWRIIDDSVPKQFPSWRRSTSCYLFTHAFDETSPLCCGDSSWPIPLYLLPITDEDRDYLDRWADSYRLHDKLWVDSGALEIPAYKQLANPKSQLCTDGREFCAMIESATKKPTYYYLFRYWGREVGEATRPCPLCGRKWHLPGQEDDNQPFQQFHFRCKRCRLVSHRAVSFEDERHARIGEFNESSRKSIQRDR